MSSSTATHSYKMVNCFEVTSFSVNKAQSSREGSERKSDAVFARTEFFRGEPSPSLIVAQIVMEQTCSRSGDQCGKNARSLWEIPKRGRNG